MATGENTGETAEITLKTKLIQLGRARDKSDNVLKGGKEHVIRRHRNFKRIANRSEQMA